MARKRTKKNKTVAPAQVVVAVPTPIRQSTVPSQGLRHRLKDKELLVRIDDPRYVFCFPLLPGRCHAPKLDAVVHNYSWAEWSAPPKLRYKALSSPASDGVWYYKVAHDMSFHDVMDPARWNPDARSFSAHKASLDWSVEIPLRAMVSKRVSPLNTSHGSFILCSYRGSEPAKGEFWLDYDVSMGGVAAALTPPVQYYVRNGVFYDPISGQPINGIPLAANGHSSHYHFAPPLPSCAHTRDFASLHEGVPTAIVRADHAPIIKPNSSVSELVMVHPKDHKLHHAKAIWDDIVDIGEHVSQAMPLVTNVVRKVAQGAKWLARTVGLVALSREAEPSLSGTFGTYTGHVLVRQGAGQHLEMHGLSSLLPVFENSDGTRTVGPGFLTNPGVMQFGAAVLKQSLSKAMQQPKLVHKGLDALSFLGGPTGAMWAGPEGGPGGGSGGGGFIDPEMPPVELPDVPNFDELDSPGTFIPWETTNRHISGYVTDANGTPQVKWLGATYGKMPLHVAAPGPRYYSNDKMPWDSGTKRYLGCYVEVDREVGGCYLLLHCTSWGDDGATHWARSVQGGTYLGTVARFAGLTESRSVVRVEDTEQWNSAPIHLLIGQSTQKYFSADAGRACVFHLTVGAVKDVEIAKKFLEAFQTSGSTKMFNVVWRKDQSEAITELSSVSDIRAFGRSALPAELEPLAPGFASTYTAYNDNKGRALSIAIEAGPFRGLLLARVDDANGWWQHVPYCAYSYTSLSSRWTVTPLLGAESSTTHYTARTETAGAQIPAVKIQAPPSLAAGAYMVVETTCLNGDSGYRCHVATDDPSSRFPFMVTIPGPMSLTRWRSTQGASTATIYVVGDTSRPSTAVDGHSGDEYVCLSYTIYLVKDIDIARKWVYHEMDTAMAASTDNVQSSVTDLETSAKTDNSLVLYNCVKNDQGTYLPATQPTWACRDADWRSKNKAPLHTSNPLYTRDGRSLIPAIMQKPWHLPFPDASPSESDDETVATR